MPWPTALLLLALPCALQAQVVRGRVLDDDTDRPVRLATLELLDDRDRVLAEALSDSTGAFRLRAWRAGKYRVRATGLGYESVTSRLLELATGEEFVLDVRLATDAVPLEPITVVSRSQSSLTDIRLQGYSDRRDYGRRIGLGRFLDRAEIEERGSRLSDVLRRVAGLRIVQSVGLRCAGNPIVTVSGNPTGTSRLDARPRRSGQDCIPPDVCPARLYLDGMALDYDARISVDQIVPLDWVEAIEVYRRASEMPAEFLGSSACGVVAIWTRGG